LLLLGAEEVFFCDVPYFFVLFFLETVLFDAEADVEDVALLAEEVCLRSHRLLEFFSLELTDFHRFTFWEELEELEEREEL